MLNNSSRPVHDFMQVAYTDQRHLAASIFFNEEVPAVERSNVRCTDFIAVEVLKKAVKFLERKVCCVPANCSSKVSVVFSSVSRSE